MIIRSNQLPTDLGSDVFIHSSSDVQTENVGEGSTVWQYCVILSGAKIGKKCNINAHCFIENDVTVGDNVTLKCGVFLWDGITIEDDVFIGPNVTFSNDRYPKSKNREFKLERTIVKKGASIGAGATILPGVTIGENVLVGAGSVVTHDVIVAKIRRGGGLNVNDGSQHITVVGNPARPIIDSRREGRNSL